MVEKLELAEDEFLQEIRLYEEKPPFKGKVWQTIFAEWQTRGITEETMRGFLKGFMTKEVIQQINEMPEKDYLDQLKNREHL